MPAGISRVRHLLTARHAVYMRPNRLGYPDNVTRASACESGDVSLVDGPLVPAPTHHAEVAVENELPSPRSVYRHVDGGVRLAGGDHGGVEELPPVYGQY